MSKIIKNSAIQCGTNEIKCHSLDITLYYGLTSAITQYGKWVSNITRHTFSRTPFWFIIILGKHFPQTRRSLDRDQAKACLPNKNVLLRKSTYYF